jgi:hypothetical protein
MGMLLRSRYFVLAVILVVIQQIFIAISTFAIAGAGQAIVDGQVNNIVSRVVWFFGMIAAAYVVGAMAHWLTVVIANRSWKSYSEKLIAEIAKDPALSSDGNKVLTNAWISGEALSTFETTSQFFIDLISISLNIGLTVFAFYEVLGIRITTAVAGGLTFSVVIILTLRDPIGRLASRIQNAKVEALVAVQALWDHAFWGNWSSYTVARQRSSSYADAFLRASSQYKGLEQIMACTPILISLPLLAMVAAKDISSDTTAVGALVALLPRTLQLFQNLHTALSYGGQLLLTRAKLRNLDDFPLRLERRDLAAQILPDQLHIVDQANREIAIEVLLSESLVGPGRITIRGPNGCGKSTLLKLIKTHQPDAVLLGPQIQIVESRGSTGERQLQAIHDLIGRGTRVLLLDEWDANLDRGNREKMDLYLQEFARRGLIIEVRH